MQTSDLFKGLSEFFVHDNKSQFNIMRISAVYFHISICKRGYQSNEAMMSYHMRQRVKLQQNSTNTCHVCLQRAIGAFEGFLHKQARRCSLSSPGSTSMQLSSRRHYIFSCNSVCRLSRLPLPSWHPNRFSCGRSPDNWS